MRLVVGVVGLNAIFVAVGYCVLSASLQTRHLATWASYWGVALLVGAGLVGVALSSVAVTGARTGVSAFALTAAALAGAGVLAGRLAPERWRARVAAPRLPEQGSPSSRIASIVATVAGFGVVAVCATALIGGFRSASWLDDTWSFWLARGVALDRLGLDPGLFASNTTYAHLANPYYPLWWSLVTNLDVRFAGAIDFRALNAQATILVIAFVAAAARLLSGRVRPSILWPGLLLLVAAPGVFRQAQGGGADLPLAFYLTLFVLAASGWLVYRQGFGLLLAFTGAAAAFAMKREGLPLLLIFLVVISLLAGRRRRRSSLGVWAVGGLAFLTSVPWLAWQWAHGVRNNVSGGASLKLGSIFDHAGQAAQQLWSWSLRPSEWLFVLPLFAALVAVGAVRERRLYWLGPALILAVGYAFWVWVLGTDPYYTVGSFPVAYRLVDPFLVLACVFIPLLAERLLSIVRPAP